MRPFKFNPLAMSSKLQSMTPEDMRLCCAIGDRAVKIVKDWARENRKLEVEPDWMIISLDIAIVHLSRSLNLRAFLECDDLTFIDEFSTIERNINRTLASFPNFVRLRFAQSALIRLS
jgi:hypothetical protein